MQLVVQPAVQQVVSCKRGLIRHIVRLRAVLARLRPDRRSSLYIIIIILYRATGASGRDFPVL